MNLIGLVAEVKLTSPFGFRRTYTPTSLFDTAQTHGNWISIHTDARWGGSWLQLKRACQLSKHPILAKGFHSIDTDIELALSLGAKAVLVVDRIPDKSLLPYCWLEPREFTEENLVDRGVPIVINSRNLKTGYSRCWLKLKREDATYIAASNMRHPRDVPNWASGWIVGEHLPEFVRFIDKHNYDISSGDDIAP